MSGIIKLMLITCEVICNTVASVLQECFWSQQLSSQLMRGLSCLAEAK